MPFRPLKTQPPKDQTTRYAYDKAGRGVHVLSAEGIVTAYEYDDWVMSFQYCLCYSDSDYRLNPLDTNTFKNANDRTRHFVYDAAGHERYRISAEGRVIERRYDGVGHIIAQLTHAVPVRHRSIRRTSYKVLARTNKPE